MSNNKSKLISGTMIQDVSLIKINRHPDQRGAFTEIFRSEWGTLLKPVQWSFVTSNKNVLRGMHYHHRHDEYFYLIHGHCLVALADIRKNSSTENAHSLFELFSNDPVALIFPRGLIHGWYFYENSSHIQAVSENYSEYGQDDNLGVHWNAPDLNIPWPKIAPKLSERAANFSTVSFLKTLISS